MLIPRRYLIFQGMSLPCSQLCTYIYFLCSFPLHLQKSVIWCIGIHEWSGLKCLDYSFSWEAIQLGGLRMRSRPPVTASVALQRSCPVERTRALNIGLNFAAPHRQRWSSISENSLNRDIKHLSNVSTCILPMWFNLKNPYINWQIDYGCYDPVLIRQKKKYVCLLSPDRLFFHPDPKTFYWKIFWKFIISWKICLFLEPNGTISSITVESVFKTVNEYKSITNNNS
jgi:hypothetical protein